MKQFSRQTNQNRREVVQHDHVIDPNDIHLMCTDSSPIIGHNNQNQDGDINHDSNLQLARTSGFGQAIVFPQGPPPPLDFCEEDVPECETSSQVQISVADSSFGATPKDISKLQKHRALQLMAVQHLDSQLNHLTNTEETSIHQKQNYQTTNERQNQKFMEISGSSAIQNLQKSSLKRTRKLIENDRDMKMHTSILEQIVQPTAAQPQVQLTTMTSIQQKKQTSKFSEIFPRLNEQAIDLLVKSSEPETALDVLRQALSELNIEKQITDDMPHYRHKLVTEEQKTSASQSQPLSKQHSHSASKNKKNTTQQQTFPGKKQQSNKKQNPINGGSKANKQSLQLSKANQKALMPDQQLGSPDFAKNHKDVMQTFFDKQQQKPPQQRSGGNNTQQLPKNGTFHKNGQSTKCASSNSTWEPSSNNIASSIKSSLVTTPTTASMIALSQTDLKEKTRESNLIVCLYYNLACCYQRLGLLEEAVEYLELASDQLENIVQFFEFQEETIIKQRHMKSQQQQIQVVVSQYATEQPQRSANLDQNALEYGKQGGLQNDQKQIHVQSLQSQHSTQEGQRQSQQLTKGASKQGLASQTGNKKRAKETKRDKISIKDCSIPTGRESQTLNCSPCDLVGSSKAGNQLQRMSQDASKLLQSKTVIKGCDLHLSDMHNSAEQLVKTTTQTIIPKHSNQLQFASFTNINYSSLIEKNSSSGRNVSPVTSASMPPESTFLSNNLGGSITIEQLLAEKMHKSRYQCKMNLQICALQSQLAKHQDALIYGRRAAQICFRLIKNAQMLCKRYVQQIQRHIQARKAKASHELYGNTLPTVPDQNSTGESPDSRKTRPQKAQTEINDSFSDDYQAAQFYRKPRTRMETGSISSTYTTLTNNKFAKRRNSGAGNIGKSLKRPRSSCSSSQSSTTSQQSLTRLKLSKESLAVLNPKRAILNGQSRANHQSKMIDAGSRSSRDSSHPGTTTSRRESSTESLDRIHTFSLKIPANQIQDARHSQSVTESTLSAIQCQSKPKSVYEKVGPETSTFGQPFESITGLKVARIDGAPLKKSSNYDQRQEEAKIISSLKEGHVASTCLQKYVQEAELFESATQQHQSRGRNDSQTTFTPAPQQKKNVSAAPNQNRNVYIEESIKVLESLIIQADPLLQELASIVKEFEDKNQKSAMDRDQEMIRKYGQADFKDQRKRLKISFSNLQELLNIEKDQRFKLNVRNTLGVKNSQDWIFNLNIGNVMHLNMMKEQELNAKIENTHELTKDTMLEKVVLITSAYFCIATEIRFILQKEILDVKMITKKDSEAFHAKALHIALLFLPEDCPLSQYIHQTYSKNYLSPKLKLQKQRNAYISQKLSKQHQTRQKQIAQNQAEKDNKKQSDLLKRPQTVLSTNQQISKMLLSNKSLEGLIPFQVPQQSTGIDFSHIKCYLPPKTATAAQTKSAHQAAVTRKQVATPDLVLKKQSHQVNQVSKKQLLNHGSAPGFVGPRQSHCSSMMTLKKERPSVAINKDLPKKQLKRQSGTFMNTLSRPISQPNQAESQNPIPKLRLQSPSSSQSAYHCNKNSQQGAKSMRSAGLPNNHHNDKNRDSSSIRKIKIDLGQLCGHSPDNKSSGKHHQHSLLVMQHHARSSSLKKQFQVKKPQINGYCQSNNSASGYLAASSLSTTSHRIQQQQTQNASKTGMSRKANLPKTILASQQSQQSLTKQHQSQQIRQSMGDSAAGSCSTAGPSCILQMPFRNGIKDNHQQQQMQQASSSNDVSTTSKQKQKAIMLATLKMLKVKSLGGPNLTNKKKLS